MSIDPNKFGITKSLIDAVNEALKGGQVKIDKNHNGKIDGQDFKMLRKEENIDEISLKTKIKAYAATREPDADYNRGDKVHSQGDRLRSKIVAKHGEKAGDHADRAAYGKPSTPATRSAEKSKSDPLTKATSSTNKMRITKSGVANKQDQKSNAAVIKSRIGKHGKSNLPEDIEQVDELSKATLGSYIKKAATDVATNSAATGRHAERSNKIADHQKKTGDYSKDSERRKDSKTADKAFDKSWKRRQGINKATDKLTKEEVVDEAGMSRREAGAHWDANKTAEKKSDTMADYKNKTAYQKAALAAKKKVSEGVEQVDELSKATLGSYVNKSAASLGKAGYNAGSTDGTAAKLDPHIHTINKRSTGIKRAVGKLAKEDTQIDELSTDTYHSAAQKAAKRAMGDAQGRSGPIFKKYAGMANKFRDKGMSQEKKEKAVKEAYDDNSSNVSDWSDKKLKWHKEKMSSSSAKAHSELVRRSKTGQAAPKKTNEETLDEIQGTYGNGGNKKNLKIIHKGVVVKDYGTDTKPNKASRDKKAEKMKAYRAERDKNMEEANTMTKVKTTKDIGYKVVDVGPGQKEKIVKAHNWTEPKKKTNEENIDELSKNTLASYGYKAGRQMQGNQPSDPDKFRKRINREKGSKLAYGKYYGHKVKVPATEETDPGFAEAAENPMAKQLADKKAAIQKTIVQKKMQVMQSKANKQMSSMKEGKCSCTEGKKSMTCETHGDKAMGMKGGKEPILMNPPLRD